MPAGGTTSIDWRHSARCRDEDPDTLFVQGAQQRDAREVCRACPVRTECLADVLERMLPYWHEAIVPDLRAGRTVLVGAHGNSLRALVKHLDGIDEQTIPGLNIPTGIPLRYDLEEGTGGDLRPTNPGGTYLDPDAAQDAIAAVANQGR